RSQSLTEVNINIRVLKVLGLPLLKRIFELTKMFERFPVRQLREIFPQLVYSMFGLNGNPAGWGLRTTTDYEEKEFECLMKFFGVTGPWMRLCHSLVAEPGKFELDVCMLPPKFVEMLGTGTNPVFYVDIINVDRMGNHLGTLSLNAFDFYVIHFVLHAMKPLHYINTIAMEIHNLQAMTVYQELVSDYLSNFLPLYPDSRIEPMDISGVKAPQPVPSQTVQPQRQPRYLRIPASLRIDTEAGGDSIANNGRSAGSPSSQRVSGRLYAWRSESVLHLFADIWLRCDFESDRLLPSSEFVLVVRSLIKQVHFFASTVEQDHSSLWALRRGARTIIKARIYAFMCGLIDHWPRNNSVILVLDFWLCYIQPWRYTLAALNQEPSDSDGRPPIPSSFDAFIIDNLMMYTHIFVLLLPRFDQLDYTVNRNVDMLDRLAVIFSQDDLIERLQRYEGLNAFDSTQRAFDSTQLSAGTQWSTVFPTHWPKLFSEPMKRHMETFLLPISLGRNAVFKDIEAMQNQITERKRAAGPIKHLYNKLRKAYKKDEEALEELRRIPDILRECIEAFCNAFNVDPANLSMYENLPNDPPESPSVEKFSFFDSNNVFDISKINPRQMWINAANLEPTIDPALLPIRSNEVRFFVLKLHGFSMIINDMFGGIFEAIYNRDDYFGRLAKRLLYGPMTEKWFEKRNGSSVRLERPVPPRLCLRSLSSVHNIALILMLMFFARLLWGTWTYGTSMLVLIFLSCHMVLAVFF
ncbi:hypothetical protein KR018_010105, partial [Drosophila ironensis]